ncbi:MAG TPA: peptidylprolyl isomerase [Bacteroidales bacterium]|nr:MAG: hypothetical protein A2W98_00460 [Bacteroidetes bacterium GWF2_33_38]OFY90226.1 MAG: hypothetical protein A2236_02780 [Bacteroidetes bacterium RIFOXYA2_FULL_33_7]HBF88249.1 peptidylprolyl isomerase [Bacteroidales bacterium]
MEIKKDCAVSLIYELRINDENGELVEKIDEQNALDFVFGSGSLLKDFESNIKGLKKGGNFQFSLTSIQAYGEYNDEALVEIPKDVFKDEKGKINDKMLVLGSFVPMQDGQGNMFNGKIIEINDNAVHMDFNHPLAGQNLFFKGEIIEVREATQEELSHGHIHKDGCSSCGCH